MLSRGIYTFNTVGLGGRKRVARRGRGAGIAGRMGVVVYLYFFMKSAWNTRNFSIISFSLSVCGRIVLRK